MGALSGQLLYFAYGADLRRDEFVRRCPGADWLGPARLEGYRFVVGAQGIATVRPEAGAVVWGVLWLVPAGELPALDALAGVAEGRGERTTRKIISPAGPRIEAMMYIGPSKGPTGACAEGYLEGVIAGAEDNRLPADYIKELKALAQAAR